MLDKFKGCLRKEVSRKWATTLGRGYVVWSKNPNVDGIWKEPAYFVREIINYIKNFQDGKQKDINVASPAGLAS